ncbi:DNA repair protein rad5 [Podosphaera aphanis]|nr:DNA repair protein rad5 [Podosphaera aphanis]
MISSISERRDNMYSSVSDEPPTKKRRFFTENSDLKPTLSEHPSNDTRELPERPSTTLLESNGSPESSLPSDVANHTNVSPKFEKETLESFVGNKVAPEVIQELQKRCGDDLGMAVNMYLDGSYKVVMNASKTSQNPPTNSSQKLAPKPEERKNSRPAPVLSCRNLMPEFRYIGAFGCEGWATKSSNGKLKHGDAVHIERQKIQPFKPVAAKKKNGLLLPAPKLGLAASRRVDVLVRFTNTIGEEIGRLSQNYADWVSILIDQGVCKFEGSCVYAPERIRAGDTVFLQLRCSICRTAFDGDDLTLPDNRSTGIFEEKESVAEKGLRQRQTALVTLFKEINLLPSKTSETSQKHKHERLLQAAKATEEHEIVKTDQPPSSGVPASSSSNEEAEDGKELEQDQLDELYKKAQKFDFNAPAAEPADTFAMDLRYYQKQALHWMLSKEKGERDAEREISMHPLWEEYTWPVKDMDDKDLPRIPDQKMFYVNPYSGQMSLEFPVQEHQCFGGILADEMGLGKTIEMMSLIHSHKTQVASERDETDSAKSHSQVSRKLAGLKKLEYAPCTTLVIAPMSLIAQWQSEAEVASVDGSIKTMVYYGSEKSTDLKVLCCEANAASAPDVIVTSYGVILSEYNQVTGKNNNRSASSGLFSLRYFRVILDEAHYIKNRQSKTSKACYEIEADHRWALTGTPIVNKLEDLFSLVHFLRVDPWSNFSFWRTFITVPFESKNFVAALDVVQTVLEPLVLRRTKDMKTPTGEALVPLPQRTIDIVNIELSQPEREVYEHILTKAKRTLEENVEAGTVLRAYTSIFAQILRLRQSCCHPVLTRNPAVVADEEDAAQAADAANGLADDMDLQSLIERFTAETDDPADANIFGASVLKQIQSDAENECPICSEEPMIERTVTGCWHSACKKCLLDYIKHQREKDEIPRCISCREVLNTRDMFEVVKDERGSKDESPKISLQRIGSTSSAKISALVSHLKGLRRDSPGCKSVVFSQFTSFLSLIEPALNRAFIPFLRLDGSMAQKSRASVLSKFASSQENTVLLLSLRAGGVGLNLTMAKRVFMMDPWWSFAVESQAIDRVYRMGQTDEVKVYRFIVQNSVEEQMLKIQDRKKFIASSLGMMSVEDKRLQRLDDIKELLS